MAVPTSATVRCTSGCSAIGAVPGRLQLPRLGHLDHVLERGLADPEIHRGVAEPEPLQVDGESMRRARR